MPDEVPDEISSASWLRAGTIGGGLAVAALLGLVVWLIVVVVGEPSSQADDRQAALAAARQAAVDFGTYDYHHAAQDFARMRAESTGNTMASQIREAVTSLVPAIQRLKGTSKASVLAAGIADSAPGRYAVVAAVDENVTNTTVPNGDQHRYRFLLVMSKVHGRWLVSNLEQA